MNIFARKKLVGFVIFVAAFAATHFLVLFALPYIIEDKAISLLESKGVKFNTWYAAPRVEPEVQPVVRASPDLSYALCLIDLSDGPMQISAPKADNYGSLSVFDGNTDNAYVGSLMGSGTLSITVYKGDMPTIEAGEPVQVHSNQVVALVRRLAPTAPLFEESASLVSQSVCAPLKQ
ncbi:DUF1254 domain-containing protein [Rhizobium sp. L1K21]|uniref:DUF1254 domain-containing protein n=1 Tax=Rhizobium sp. L1K21 TaxID=2954933 RepID=UPI00209359A4|nr:DUF1254 domain-containing protein [Rhizobium sp. L1K21]MCO6186008.1 DUF1254 domain-containing protein [Rhizobium sp. L1K21]